MTDEDIAAGGPEGAQKPQQKPSRSAKKPARKAAKSSERKSPSKAAKQHSDGISAKTGLFFLGAIALLFGIYYMTNAAQSPAGPAGSGSEVPVNVVFLNDQRCGKECDLSRLDTELRKAFPTMIVKSLDISSQEGKSLYQSTNTGMLPAVLFEKSVKDSKGYSMASRFLDPAGDYLSLRIGANWDPYCDPAPDNCAEARCAGRISCRKETTRTLDLFIMSQCPYGVQAADSMREVLDAFKGEMQFSLHFIGQLDKSGVPISLHGQAEVDEDLRELCAEKYYPQDYKFMDYVWCRNKDLKAADWAKCANDSGLDAAKIKSCAEGEEGKALLADSFRQGDSLQIFSSPTFFLNNKKLFGAVTAADIQTAYCETNAGLAGCAKALGNQSAVPSGSCG
jgi:hypothetical protein